jgi:hypothetical protein
MNEKLYGQFTRLACLIDKEADFQEELKLFAPIARAALYLPDSLFGNFKELNASKTIS